MKGIKMAFNMKTAVKVYLTIGFILGLVFALSIIFYGQRVAVSAYQEFKATVKVNTQTATFKSTNSDSEIVVYWTEEEELPYKEAITVRVGNDEKKKIRTIVFKKQK